VLVQAHLGDAGLGDDPVDAHGPDAFLVEQPVSGFQDALPGFRGFSWVSHARNIQTCLFIVKPLAGFLLALLQPLTAGHHARRHRVEVGPTSRRRLARHNIYSIVFQKEVAGKERPDP
jgi:hypothetical protein